MLPLTSDLDSLVNTHNLVSVFSDMLSDLSCKKIGEETTEREWDGKELQKESEMAWGWIDKLAPAVKTIKREDK